MADNEQVTVTQADPAADAVVTVEASPVTTIPVPVARPIAAPGPPAAPGGAHLPVPRRTDPLAIGSAVCGIAAIVPVVCQALGLALGIASLVRIRRARRAGIALGGWGWALVGIVASGLTLVSWMAAGAALSAVGGSLSNTDDALRLLQMPGG